MYRRTEDKEGYQNITEVTETGTYKQWSEWPDGFIWGLRETTLHDMGWDSLQQFLKARPAFQKVEQ